MASTRAATIHADHQPASPPRHGHAVPLWVLAGVLVALIVLTVATVASSEYFTAAAKDNPDLRSLALAVALFLATLKVALVALYFMHLRYDHGLHGVILIAAFLFVALFILVTLQDTFAYQQDMTPPSISNPGI